MTYDSTNIFAKIIAGEIPNTPFYEDDNILAFEDIAPAAPVHILVIPKGQYSSFNDFTQSATPETIADFFAKVQVIATKAGVEKSGYRLITNHGADASQTVPHFHVHILGGKPLGGLIASDSLVR